MISTLSTATLERKFPLLGIENDCIVSKNAEITAAYRMRLPPLYTVTAQEYEAVQAA